MNIIGMWIVTVVVSQIMKIKLFFQLYKDIADSGYKFNIDKIEEINEKFNLGDKNTNSNSKYKVLIPGYNLWMVLNQYQDYYNKRNEIFYVFNAMDVLEELTEDEKEQYNKKRTGFHAFVMYYQRYQRLENAQKVILNDGSTIWFEYNKKDDGTLIDEITILKTDGRISFQSEEQQKKSAFRVMGKLAVVTLIKYNSKDIKKELLKNKDVLNKTINEEELDSIIKETYTEEKIEETNKVIENVTKLVSDQKNNQREDGYSEDNDRDRPKTRIRRR